MQQVRNIVVVGAGRVGRAVLAELLPDWRVTVVDVSAAALAALPPRAGREDVVGDATSRLVLGKCPLNETTTLVLCAGSDEVNVEVARVAAQEFGVDEIVAVLDTTPPAPPPNATVVARDAIAAAQVLNRIGTGETRGVGLGLGQGELRQVAVLPGSPASGRPLRDLHARGWLVAAVYREGRLIVPHGDTDVRPGDQVLLVGEPGELGAIAAFFRGGAATFPAAYGARLGCVGPRMLEVGERVAGRLAVRETVEVPPVLLDPGITRADTLAQAIAREGVGCLLVEPRPVAWTARFGLTTPGWAHQLLAAQVPVIVVRDGLQPKRIVVAVGPEHDARLIGGAAIDLSMQFGVPLQILTVLPPTLSPDAEGAADPTRDLVAYARLHGGDPARTVERGNPIERIRAACRPDDLLVIGHSRARRTTMFTPDVSTYLLHHAPCSTVFVPWARANGAVSHGGARPAGEGR